MFYGPSEANLVRSNMEAIGQFPMVYCRCVHTGVLKLLGHAAERVHLLLLGRMHHHHRGPEDAQQAAHFAVHV